MLAAVSRAKSYRFSAACNADAEQGPLWSRDVVTRWSPGTLKPCREGLRFVERIWDSTRLYANVAVVRAGIQPASASRRGRCYQGRSSSLGFCMNTTAKLSPSVTRRERPISARWRRLVNMDWSNATPFSGHLSDSQPFHTERIIYDLGVRRLTWESR
jgi:hypothetical protein